MSARRVLIPVMASLTILLIGCGSADYATLGGTTPLGPAPGSFGGSSFAVHVIGDGQALAGASVQIYASGTTGNGSAPTALLSSSLLTDSAGGASIPATYSCPSASSELYAVARGGRVNSVGSSNVNTALMTAIGRCDSISTGSTVTVNELSSAAALFSLNRFYAAGGSVGSTATNATGLANAFVTAASLVAVSSGVQPGTLPQTATAPVAKLNSVANLISACVRSAANCPAFFSAVGGGGAQPTDTLDALALLSRSPGTNVASLYMLSQQSSVYTPALTAVPPDWTIAVTYGGGGLASPTALAVDSSGNVWVANYLDTATKLSPTGAPLFSNGITGNGLDNSYGLAVDASDNVWIANEQPYQSLGTGSVTKLTANGTTTPGGGVFVAGGMNYPIAVAIDPAGPVWVANYGNSHILLLGSDGTPMSGANGFSSSALAFPVAVAVDGNHAAWIANQASNTVTRINAAGSTVASFPCCTGASGIAIDQANNAWVTNYYGDSVSLVLANGTVASSGTFTGGGSMSRPQGIAVDGDGNIWVANYRKPYLTELAGVNGTAGMLISPTTGFGADAALLEAYSLAIDATGSIWVANQGSDTITRFLGLAAPVKTPLLGVPQQP